MVTSREKEFLAWAAGAYAEKTGVPPQINWGRDTVACKRAIKWATEGYPDPVETLKLAYRNYLEDSYWSSKQFPILSFLAEPHKYVLGKKVAPTITEYRPTVRNTRTLTDDEIAKSVSVNPAAYIKALKVGSQYGQTLQKLNPELYGRVRAHLLTAYRDKVKEMVTAKIVEEVECPKSSE